MKKISKSHNACEFLMYFLYAEGLCRFWFCFFFYFGEGCGESVFFVIFVGVLFLFNLAESARGIIKTKAGESFYVGSTQFYVPGEKGSFVFTQYDPPGS